MADEVRVVAVLNAQEGAGGQVLAAWPALSAQVHAEDGCLSYDLHPVLGQDDRFVVLERWASLAALAAHGRSPHMREFGTSAAAYLAGPPDVTVLADAPVA